MSDSVPHTRPIFIKSSSLPPISVSPVDLCEAAERASGLNSVFGVQKAGGVFRLYPASEAARSRLLAVGFSLHGTRILPLPVNPRRLFFKDGVELKASRLIISNVPLSVSERDILSEVRTAGYSPLSPLSLDCLRDKAGLLTRFKNGNRSLFVETPKSPLPTSVKIQGKFTAFLYYPEREEVEKARNDPLVAPPPSDIPAVPPVDTGSDTVCDSSAVCDTEISADATPTPSPDESGCPADCYEGGEEGELLLSGVSLSGEQASQREGVSQCLPSHTDSFVEDPVSDFVQPPPAPKRSSVRSSRPRAKSVSPRQRDSSRSIIRFLVNGERAGHRSDSRKRTAGKQAQSDSKRVAPS